MPYTRKAHNFFGLCSTPKGRKKAKAKCPPMKTAKKMLHEGVKSGKGLLER